MLDDNPVLKERLMAFGAFAGTCVFGLAALNVMISGGFDFGAEREPYHRQQQPSAYVRVVEAAQFVSDRAREVSWNEPMFIGEAEAATPEPLAGENDGTPSQGEVSDDYLRQQIAALAGGEGMDLINHDPLQRTEHLRCLWIGQQQTERFGRGQQHVRWTGALPSLAIGRRVATARFNPQRQAQIRNRRQQVALHIMRQRLERRNVEGVQTIGRGLGVQHRRAEIGERRQEPGQGLARAGIGHQQGMLPSLRGGQHRALVTAHPPAARGKPLLKFRRQTLHRRA